jgi:hypothetical protein
MKKLLFSALLILIFQLPLFATEGMWIPSLINMFYSDMKTFGLKLKPEDIYATNKSSLKDAIVQFNGGCTAEIISSEGLLLTNHHCGVEGIQSHSSVQNDLLKNGFWAKNKSEELPCKGMYVTFVKEIRDVTKEVLKGVNKSMSVMERTKLINQNIAEIEKQTSENNVTARIKAFNNGNQYFMLLTEDFYDIRLVGAPPSFIGNYGGDVDNWVWPRHTGDFSIFRIYAGKDNKSSEYDPGNVPFKPAHSLPISLKPKKQGDFTMVYGFPGRTDQHYSSEKIKFYQEKERPARIAMRTATIDLMAPAMNASDEIRIKYTAKQAGIANGCKKWMGQIEGLKALNVISKKLEWEKTYNEKASGNAEWQKLYGNVIQDMNKLQLSSGGNEFARVMFIEYFYYGPEFLKFTHEFDRIVNNYETLEKEDKLKKTLSNLVSATEEFFKDYDRKLDYTIFEALTPMYIKYVDERNLPSGFKSDWKNKGDNLFKNSVFLDSDKLNSILQNFNSETVKVLRNDPGFIFASELYKAYSDNILPGYTQFSTEEARLLQIYVEGLMTMFPDKKIWADANSTLRIAYGKIEGSAPHDGMVYNHFTTIDGVMQKYKPNNPDFTLTQKYIDLYNKKDFGNYAQDGKLWVNFTASNHTTNGNSGSPVIDANGNFIGINFDRSWESTMSDFVYDASRCRNIVVDSRYILWIIEKYGEAGHLIQEMKLVK